MPTTDGTIAREALERAKAELLRDLRVNSAALGELEDKIDDLRHQFDTRVESGNKLREHIETIEDALKILEVYRDER